MSIEQEKYLIEKKIDIAFKIHSASTIDEIRDILFELLELITNKNGETK